MTVGERFVGQRVLRHEDARFLTGRGRYVDDIPMPGTLHVAFARSDVARGSIVSVDTSARRRCPASSPCSSRRPRRTSCTTTTVDDEPPGGDRPFRLLADGDVRYVGEPIAMVVADSRYRAEDARRRDRHRHRHRRSASSTPTRALDADAPLVHPSATSNLYGTRFPPASQPRSSTTCSRRRRSC